MTSRNNFTHWFIASFLISLLAVSVMVFDLTKHPAQAQATPPPFILYITSLSSSLGPVGTVVNIQSTYYGGTSGMVVRFGGASVPFLSTTDSSITFTVPETITPCSLDPGMNCAQVATPVTAGNYQVEIAQPSPSGSSTFYTSNSLTFTVTGSDFSITTSSPLPTATAGTSYSANIVASGGEGSYLWSLTSGSLPPGLDQLTAQCFVYPCQEPVAIIGTPTTTGTYNFTITATTEPVGEGPSLIASKQFTLTVDPAISAPLVITTSSPLPNARVGSAYSITVYASGGTGAYTWMASSDYLPLSPLPPGLNFAPNPCLSCQSSVTVSGVPTTAGTYVFKLQVSTSATISTFKYFTLTVDPAIQNQVNIKPLGWLDSVADGFINGWAYDPNHPGESIEFHIYFDGPAAPGRNVSATQANVLRGDVNQVFAISGNHGLSFAIPQNMRDGRSHTVYVYAIDKDDSSNTSNVELYGSGKTFTLGSGTTGRHDRGSVVIDSSGTAYFLGATLRYPFPNPTVFFSWGHSFSSLVPANAPDLAMPLGPVVTMRY